MTDNIKPTVQEKSAWAKVPQEFNDWWNSDYSDESNPFRTNSAAYWAWAGWSEAVRLNAQAQKPRTISDSDQAFDEFWKGINPAGLTKRNLAKVAWRISHQQTKKGINSMKLSDAFDGSQAENLTVLDLSDKQFLRDLAAHAKERAECTGTTPAWAATYMALEASATMLADLIEQTEVEDV